MPLQNNQLHKILKSVFIGASILYLGAIHFSPSIASISSICLILIAFSFFLDKRISHFLQKIQLLFFAIFAYSIASSLFHGCEIQQLMPKLLVRLPLVFIPSILGYSLHNNLLLSRYWMWYALPVFWTSLASVVNYFVHYKFLSQMVLESKPVPIFSQVYHIEFSVIVAMMLLALLIWKIEKRIESIWGNQVFFYVIFGGLFAALHILSARTGILCFWTGSLFILARQIKTIKLSYVVLGIMVMGLMWFVPSVKNRVINTVEDISYVIQGKDLNNKSFGQRWEAWKAIVHAGSKTPWVGVGQCQIEARMQASFEALHSNLDQENRISPHNQFLQWFIELGLVGLFVYIVQFAILMIQMRRNGMSEYVWAVLMSIVFGLNFESMMERQAGVMIILVSLLFISYQTSEKNANNERKEVFS